VPNAEIDEMLEDVETAAHVGQKRGGIDLTKWEKEFIESVHDQYNRRGTLTTAQIDKLRQIWDRI